MAIVDLRQISSRQLAPLFEEEARHWREELQWDYRPSLDLVRKFLDARSLSGYADLEEGKPAGYGFYVLEDHKGLMGGLYVSARYAQAGIGQRIFSEMFATLRGLPRIERIEAQIIPFGCALDESLAAHGFRQFTRQFMLLPLTGPPAEAKPVSEGLRLERWQDRHFEPCARLIQLAYTDHVDGEINDQYRTEAGALKFLKNIILLPGCGQFQADASFLLHAAGGGLIGVVLTSAVSRGVGHTTQICVLPGYQGRGLGRLLMEASVRALRSLGYHALSLTVTSANAHAVELYEHLGFRTIKSFAAGVWLP